MRLYDFILRGKYTVSNTAATKLTDAAFKQHTSRILRTAYCADIQNVCEWLTRDDRQKIKLEDICPILKLPFDPFWTEYDNPGGTKIGAMWTEGASGIDTRGKLVPGENAIIGAVFCQTDRFTFFYGNIRAEFDPFTLEAVSQTVSPFPWNNNLSEKQNNAQKAAYLESIRTDGAVSLAAISFFHCKNVVIRHITKPPALKKALTKKYGYEPKDFHTIEVHKYMQRTVSDAELQDTRATVRAHIVRGHFKKFEGEKKLFGKVEGMFFWEPHIRGEGAPVKKDYRVWGPAGKHAKNCIVPEGTI